MSRLLTFLLFILSHPPSLLPRAFRRSMTALLWLGLVTFSCSPLAAQVPDPVIAAQAPQPGSDHSYIGKGAETVNPADGSVTFDLPIKTPPGRQLDLPFGIRYSGAETWAMGGGSNGSFGWEATAVAWGLGGWSWDVPNLAWRSVVFTANYACTVQGEYGCLQYGYVQWDYASDFVFHGLSGQCPASVENGESRR